MTVKLEILELIFKFTVSVLKKTAALQKKTCSEIQQNRSDCFSFFVTFLLCHASEVLEKVASCSGEDLRPYENISIEESSQAGTLHRIWKGDTMKFWLPILFCYLGENIKMSGSISLIVPEFAVKES